MKCFSLPHLPVHLDSWTDLVMSGGCRDFHLCVLKAATSELAVHCQGPLASLTLTKPKHFRGPEESLCEELYYSPVTPCTESDYFRGIDLKLLQAQEKVSRSVKVSGTQRNGLRPGVHLHHSRFDPHNTTGLG